MQNENNRGQERAETAKRHDDSDIIDPMGDAPAEGSTSGGNLARDVGSRDELKQAVGEGGVTRVHDSDKPDDPNLPRYNEAGSGVDR